MSEVAKLAQMILEKIEKKEIIPSTSKPKGEDAITSWLFREYFYSDFHQFIKISFNTLNKNSNFHDNWHLHFITDYLNLVFQKKLKRVIINIPPRCLKSISTSVAWPAWLLAKSPHLKIILTTYSQILTQKHFSDIHTLMTSEWYNCFFPETTIKRKCSNKIVTKDLGFIYTTSVGGTLTGEGGDILIVDDPHNPIHIHSKKSREKVIEWYEQTFYSRLNDPDDSAIVVIMQRLHPEDLCGHLEKMGGWHILKIPIMADNDYFYKTHLREYEFLCGQTISQRFSKEAVEKIKSNLGLVNFQAQYMQQPIKKQNLIVNEMIQYVSLNEIEVIDFDFIIQSWDTAIQTSENADFSVCITFGIKKDKYYIIDIFREKLDFPALKKNVKDLIAKYNPYKVIIEDKASGQSLIQELKAFNIINIIPIRPKIDKLTRLAMNLEFFQEKKVFFINNIKQEIIEEILHFPNSRHDDVVDAISQFFHFVKTNLTNPSDQNGGNDSFFIG